MAPEVRGHCSQPLPNAQPGRATGLPVGLETLGRALRRVGRGLCVQRSGTSEASSFKVAVRFPEGLFRRGKTLSKSQPRKPAIAREAGGRPRRIATPRPWGAGRGCQAPHSPAQGTFPGPGLASGLEPRPLTVDAQALLRTEGNTSRVVTAHPGLQRDSPGGLL